MNHIVPTQITDKNGVTSIRYKKPVAVSTSKLEKLPLPAATIQPLPSIEQLVEMVYPDREFSSRKAEISINRELGALRELSPDGISSLEDYLSRGSQKSHELIRQKITSVLSSLSYTRSLDKKDGTLEDRLHEFAVKISPSELRRLWNCGNVMEESGYAHDNSVPGLLSTTIELDFKRNLPKLNPSQQGDEFWRGATAFSIVGFFFIPSDGLSKKEANAEKREFFRDALRFVEYAGKHDDIDIVIRTAMDRYVMDIDTLDSVVEQGRSKASLRDGVL